jgi:hypothetical protein
VSAMTDRRIPFTEEDERRMASAATWGLIIAVSSIATALVSLSVTALEYSEASHLEDMMGAVYAFSAGQALVSMLLHAWLLQASLSFRKGATTDEADQAHLLAGFRKLRAYFMLQVILIVLVSVGGIELAILSDGS